MGDGGSRKLILDRALSLFSARGYEAVGVAEVVESVSLTKPTLYHWFGSKRGLLDAIIVEKGASLATRVADASFYGRDLPRGLENIAFAFAKSAGEDPDFARLRLALAFAPPGSEGAEACFAFNESLFLRVESFFAAAAADHGNMRGRSRPYAATFIGTVDTWVGLFLAGRSPLDEATVRRAVRQFMYGIFS